MSGPVKLLYRTGTNKWGTPIWMCRCGCGNEWRVSGSNAKRVKSCGCKKFDSIKKKKTRHGESHTRTHKPSKEYTAWWNMKHRIDNPKAHNYRLYGQRGITLCDRWRGADGFKNFLQDVGRAPSKEHSIDRKNNNGNYEPSNVRWATRSEQAKNRRERERTSSGQYK